MENKNYEDDAISFREIIKVLLKSWKFIAICTVSALAIGMVYLFFIARPVYQSSISGSIDVPAEIETKYGTFKFASVYTSDYLGTITSDETLNKTISALGLKTSAADLRSLISVEHNSDQKNFSITVSSDSAESARLLAKTIADSFFEVLIINNRSYVIHFFIGQYCIDISSNTQKLQSEMMTMDGLKEKLSKISPLITIQESLISDPVRAAAIAKEKGVTIESLADMVIYSECVNPGYSKMEEFVLDSEKEIQKIQTDLDNEQVLSLELMKELDAVKAYWATGDVSGMTEPSLNALKPYASVADNASFSANPISPRKTFIIMISLMLGLILGAVIPLMRHYWKNV